MNLKDLLRERTPIAILGQYLDGIGSLTREAQVNALSGPEQALLFEMAGDAPPLSLDHFVPPHLAPLTPVHHAGRNTVPVPEYFQYFQKRFARSATPLVEGERERVFGYNASNAFFITPGYFVAYSTESHEREVWRERGSVVVDYFEVPPKGTEVPAAWPAVVPNDVGLQKLVYHRTRDFMRRVSMHVSIGRASREDEKGDVDMDFWFTLVRRDA